MSKQGITFKGNKKEFFKFIESLKEFAESNKAITLGEATALIGK